MRLARQGLALIVALFFAGLGLTFGGAAVVLRLPEADRPFALLGLAFACALAAAAAAWWWLHLSANAEPLLGATVAELRKDRASLAGEGGG